MAAARGAADYAGGGAERGGEAVDEAAQAGPVLLAVQGVELGQRDGREARVAREHREGRERRVEGHPLPAPDVLRERRVRELDDVDVEVHDQALGRGGDELERARGRSGRIGGELVVRHAGQAEGVDAGALVRGGVLGIDAEQTTSAGASGGSPPSTAGSVPGSPSRCATPIQSSVPVGTLAGVLRSGCSSR